MEDAVKVALDASVLINLAILDVLPLIAALDGIVLVVTENALAEVIDEAQRQRVDLALDSGRLQRLDLPQEALADFARLRGFLGAGEAVTLAWAMASGGLVACDEGGAFRREARRLIGEERIVTTPGLLLEAIEQGSATIGQADAWKRTLEVRRFKMAFGSFRDLLDQKEDLE